MRKFFWGPLNAFFDLCYVTREELASVILMLICFGTCFVSFVPLASYTLLEYIGQ